MKEPYKIETPSVISFSGGRSSGYMLYKILDYYDFNLPEDVKIVFCNTGLEHSATYDFIKDFSDYYKVEITWLEYYLDGKDNSFRVVDFDSASRDGSPFSSVINKYGYLPNPRNRFCTGVLKIQTEKKFVKSLGWKGWSKVVGLRADEPQRVLRIKDRDENIFAPLYDAQVTEKEVLDFWEINDFDLNLKVRGNLYSNCVGCFLKGYGKLRIIAEEQPKELEWWVEQEERTKRVFRKERPSYRAITKDSQNQLKFNFDDIQECNCMD